LVKELLFRVIHFAQPQAFVFAAEFYKPQGQIGFIFVILPVMPVCL
jgi:hypothetical protein